MEICGDVGDVVDDAGDDDDDGSVDCGKLQSGKLWSQRVIQAFPSPPLDITANNVTQLHSSQNFKMIQHCIFDKCNEVVTLQRPVSLH